MVLLPFDLNAALINTPEIQLPYILLYLVCLIMFIIRFLEIHLNNQLQINNFEWKV